MTLRNTGKTADALVAASAAVASSATLHIETTAGNMEMMTPLAPIPLPAGQAVTLAPGHDHVMLEAGGPPYGKARSSP